MTQTIAAIIVTFNRKQLLIKCLEAVLSQTITPNKIIIIDNASTDGTSDLLKAKGYLENPLINYILLPENTGGAGGFYQGMKLGYEGDYDWLWLMDDDGYPSNNCLEMLLQGKETLEIIGPTVVTPEDTSTLTWGVRTFNQQGQFQPKGLIYQYSQLENLAHNGWYHGFANFFNATLLKRDVITKIGLIIPELFCWGDELEYFLRCKSYQINIGTRLEAFYYHPSNPPSLSQMRYYYFLRNVFFNYRKYGKTMYPPRWRIFYPLYIMAKYGRQIPSLSPQYLGILSRGILKAWYGKLIPFPPTT